MDVIVLGKTPLIAHVERYYCVQNDPSYVYDWIEMGCLTQLNKGITFGKFGKSAQQASIPLLNYELIHCVASDAHSPIQRTPWLKGVEQFLINNFGQEYAFRMLVENPHKIVSGQAVQSYAVDPLR